MRRVKNCESQKIAKKRHTKRKGGHQRKERYFFAPFTALSMTCKFVKKKLNPQKKRNLHHTAFPVRYVDIRRQRRLL